MIESALSATLLIISLASLLPQPVLAYLGPGAGLSAIGVLLAIVAGVTVAIFGFVWYPIRRLMRKKKRTGNEKGGDTE